VIVDYLDLALHEVVEWIETNDVGVMFAAPCFTGYHIDNNVIVSCVESNCDICRLYDACHALEKEPLCKIIADYLYRNKLHPELFL